MELLFIDNNTPLDRQAQRIVRSHAMTSKNLGRTISGRGLRGRQGRIEPLPSQFNAIKHTSNAQGTGRLILPKLTYRDSDAVHTEKLTVPRNPFSGTEWSYFSTPVTLTSWDRSLIYEFHHVIGKQLYPAELCRQSNEADLSWFECLISFPCALHCGLAIAEVYRSRYLGHAHQSLESTRHFNHAIRLLRLDLEQGSEIQDSSVAVAITLAIYANLNGAVGESRIHLRGLKHMLESRPGGLAALCSETSELGNKVRRADLELALITGTPTIFKAQRVQLTSPLGNKAFPDRLRSWGNLPPPLDQTCSSVQSSARDILTICNHAGENKLGGQLGAFQYQEIVISIFQRLIDYAPLDGVRPPNLLDDVCQLGLLAFMSTFVHLNRQQKSAPSLLLKLYKTKLAEMYQETQGSGDAASASLCLWLFFVFTMSTSDHHYSYDYAPLNRQRLQALTEILGVKDWEDVIARLRVYPWIRAFHEKPAWNIWSSITVR